MKKYEESLECDFLGDQKKQREAKLGCFGFERRGCREKEKFFFFSLLRKELSRVFLVVSSCMSHFDFLRW